MLDRAVEPGAPAGRPPDPRQAPVPSEPTEKSLTAAALLAALRRWRWVLVLCALPFPVAAYIAAAQLTPRYTATATLLSETQDHQGTMLQGTLLPESTTGAEIASQIEAVRSLSIARRVARRFDLDDRPEFAWWLKDAERASTPWYRLREALARRLSAASPGLAALAAPEPPAEAPPLEDAAEVEAAEAARRRLAVQGTWNPRVLQVRFTSEDPALARDVANAVAEFYVADRLEAKLEAARRANEWFDGQVAKLQRELRQAEARIAEMGAAADRQGTDPAAPDASDLVWRREALDDARSQLRRLQAALGERHYDAAAAARPLANQAPTAEVQPGAPEREPEASRSLLHRAVLDRTRLTASQDATEEADARVLSAAAYPAEPSFPKAPPLVATAAALGALFGLSVVWFLERAHGTVRSGDEVRAALGVPDLAQVPLLRRGPFGRHRAAEDHVAREPLGSFAASMRTLRAALWLGEEPPSVVAVTAARPGEGKTTTAVALARSASICGERVLLIDCDARRPAIGRVFGAEGAPGVAELLLGRAAPERIVRRDHLTSLDYIPAGAAGIHSLGPFMSEAMAGLLDWARRDYDLVVLDAPPVLAAADARVVARLADAALLCVKWGDTPRSAARHALGLLEAAHARVAGACLTQADTRAHDRAGAEAHHPRYGGYIWQ